MIEVTKVKTHPNNVKEHPEKQIKNLMQLIKWVGFKDPIVLDKRNELKAGHGRLIAAKKLGMTEVPYVLLEGLTKKQMDLFIYMDNQINESPWIKDNVELILKDIPMQDLEMFELDWDGVIKPEYHEEEPIPEPPVEPKSKLGDIYQLGNHRVMCGDSTNQESISSLLVDCKPDLLLTDPPYGIDIVYHNNEVGGGGPLGFTSGHKDGKHSIVKAKKYRKIQGDDKPFEPEFLLQIGTKQIIFGANHFSDKLPMNSHWLVWDKKGQDNESYNDTFSDAELAWTNIKLKTTKIYRYLWSGLLRAGDRKTELKERVHPTQKPVGLFSNIIKDYSKENNIILDCYLGSGSTLIACEQTNRICYGMEIDPGYIDVIIQRWENYTGKKAINLIKN